MLLKHITLNDILKKIGDNMKKGLGERFLFDKDIKFEEIEGGEGYTYSDGSGYFNGDDGTEIYI